LASVLFGFSFLNILKYYIFFSELYWGLGIGDWGLGIGDWAQSPIPNTQYPIPIFLYNNLKTKNLKIKINIYKSNYFLK
jgi:hypothetical protein